MSIVKSAQPSGAQAKSGAAKSRSLVQRRTTANQRHSSPLELGLFRPRAAAYCCVLHDNPSSVNCGDGFYVFPMTQESYSLHDGTTTCNFLLGLPTQSSLHYFNTNQRRAGNTRSLGRTNRYRLWYVSSKHLAALRPLQ
jgi:hypothetical protein